MRATMSTNIILLDSATKMDTLVKSDEMPAYVLSADKTLFYLRSGEKPLPIPLAQNQFDSLVNQLKYNKVLADVENQAKPRVKKQLRPSELGIISKLTNHTISFAQSGVIKSLAAYLKWAGIELEPNSNGICNGLAAVYCKYVLEDREDEFFDMIQKINDKRFLGDYTQEAQLNKFVGEVLFAYLPSQFNKDLNQSRAVEQLKVSDGQGDSEKLQNLFQFSTSATAEQWASIIDTIKQEGVAYSVGTMDHAMAIRFKNGKFRLYDPNYTVGVKTFDTAIELTNELMKCFDIKQADPDGFTRLPMNIKMIGNPYKPVPPIAVDKKDLLKRLVNEPGFSVKATLELALKDNDKELVETLLAEGVQPEFLQLVTAIKENSLDVLPLALKKASLTPEEEMGLLRAAFMAGKDKAFKLLADEYDLSEAELSFRKELLADASTSANPECIRQAIALFSAREITTAISNEVIINAIKAGHTGTLGLLLEKTPITTLEDAIKFLQAAIDANQSNMVAYLTNKYPQFKAAEAITITPTLVDEKNIKLIGYLQNAGAKLQEGVGVEQKIKERQQFQLAFEKKERDYPETLSLWESFIKTLRSFTNFVKSTAFLNVCYTEKEPDQAPPFRPSSNIP